MIAGKVATARDNTAVAVYLGVPFAAPPLGELRFAPPAFRTLAVESVSSK